MTDLADTPSDGDEAVRIASEYPRPDGPPPKGKMNPARLMHLVHAAEQERRRLEAARREAEADAARAREASARAEAGLAELAEREAAMNARMLERESELLEDLRIRIARVAELGRGVDEARAEAGALLAAESNRVLDVLEASRKAGDADAEQLRTRAHAEADQVLTDARNEAVQLRETAVADTKALRAALDAETAALDSRTRELEQREREVQHATTALELGEDLAAEEARARADAELADLRRQVRSANADASAARQERTDAEAEAARLRDRLARVGDRSLDELAESLEQHQRWLAEARAELGQRPPTSTIDELNSTRARAEAAERDADSLRRRLTEADTSKAAQHRLSATVTELEQAVEEKEQSLVRLQRRIGDLRSELELLGDATDAEPVDAELVELDAASDDRAAEGRRVRELPLTASVLLGEVRARMAAAGRFYAEDDVRIFLAGLAASHLHILEGISGTGKTSLPIAFADAVGGRHEVVEVQAAWRDRIDLVGSYNAFDRRYYPTDFARALYRAATPGWADSIHVIVIDEMNLAHPEHYFADVLSAMESGKDRIEVLPRAIGTGQVLMNRRSIPIGRNVWFVGTANRDETTATIADKTYDRANLMQLPSRFTPFDVADVGADDGEIPCSALEAVFAEAKRGHSESAEAVLRVARHADLLEASEQLRIGFGNRLERMVRRFAPAMAAMDGAPEQALDHVLATKLIRRLESRFEARPEQLAELAAAIEAAAGATLDELPRTKAELGRQTERLTQ